MELVEYLFAIPGVKVFLSEKVSQDPIEKFFGCQPQRGRVNEPKCLKNTQDLRVINGMCPTVTRGNCRGNTEQQMPDTTPLHKRSKSRPRKSLCRKPLRLTEQSSTHHTFKLSSLIITLLNFSFISLTSYFYSSDCNTYLLLISL